MHPLMPPSGNHTSLAGTSLICGWCSHECLYRNFPWAYYHVDSQRVCLPLPCSVNISHYIPIIHHYTILCHHVCCLTPRSFTPSPPWSEPIKASTLSVLSQPAARRLMLEFEEIQQGKSMKSPVKKNINFPKWSRIASHLSCLEIWSICWTLRKNTEIDLHDSFLMFWPANKQWLSWTCHCPTSNCPGLLCKYMQILSSRTLL